MRIKYLHSQTSKGKTYWYYRPPGGSSTRIAEKYGTPEFWTRARELEQAYQRADGPIDAPPARGTLGRLILDYQADEAYQRCAPDTKKGYQRAFNVLREFGRLPLSALARPAILKIRTEAIYPVHGRHMANYCVTVLSIILAFGYDTGAVPSNPLAERVRHIPKPKDAPDANRPWTEAERKAVLNHAGPALRRALVLAMCTGLRKRDLLTVALSAVQDGEIAVKTSKRSVVVRIPLIPMLAHELNQRPQCDAATLLVSERNKPWTESGFNTVWQRLKRKLEKDGLIQPGLTIHGLRHTWGTILTEAGVPQDHVRRLLAHQSPAMTNHYTETAQLPEETRAAVRKLRVVKE